MCHILYCCKDFICNNLNIILFNAHSKMQVLFYPHLQVNKIEQEVKYRSLGPTASTEQSLVLNL